jgi:hypothetical protein
LHEAKEKKKAETALQTARFETRGYAITDPTASAKMLVLVAAQRAVVMRAVAELCTLTADAAAAMGHAAATEHPDSEDDSSSKEDGLLIQLDEHKDYANTLDLHEAQGDDPGEGSI